MGDVYFVSYSRVEAADLARRLADLLTAGPPSYGTWLDVRDIQPGRDWDIQVRDAIQNCTGILFLMTPDSVRDSSVTKDEWGWALKYKKPVIPLRLDANASLPFRLQSRQYIDFSLGFEVGLAKLRSYFDWLGTSEGKLQELRFRLADAERELPRAPDAGQRARVEQDVQDLRRRIAELEEVAADPVSAVAATKERITAGLEGVREPARPQPEKPARAKFVNPPPVTAPTYFQDRHVETERLAGYLAEPDARLVTVVGRGGVGKTAMVCRLLKGLESGRLPDDRGEMGVDGIVYLRTPSAHPVSFANLFTDLCRLLPAETSDRLGQRYKDPHAMPTALMAELLEEFPAEQTVVVLLDNFEDLLDDTGAIVETALDEGLRALLSAPAHGVTAVLTTRVAPQSLLLHEPGGQRQINLDEGLPSPFAERLLRARDADGRLGLKTASDEVLGVLRERTRGYPRALEAVAAILSADRNTSLPELIAQTERLPENVVKALVGEAFQRLDGLAQQVMQALAIYPVPVPAVGVDYLLHPFQPTVNAAPVLARLVNMQFVRRDAGQYYLHQVDRDYALSRIPPGQPADRDADPPPFTQFTLRDRAADYFTQIQTPRQEWKTLDDLAPQLAEFELRYQGEDYDTAAQVLLTIDFEYLITWGHYHYVIDLHTRLQTHLTDPATISASLGNLGTCYYRLGDYARSVDLYEQALAISRENSDRGGEAVQLGNLANCYADLGQTGRAIELYEQALTISRETGDREGEAAQLGNLGNRYATLGQTDRAIELHEQALAINRETGNRAGEATQLGNLGNRYSDLGQTDRAIELYQQALTIHRETGDRQGEATVVGNLGICSYTRGQIKQAIDLYEQSLTIAREIGYRYGEAAQLGYLGSAYDALGQTERAIELYQEALTITREIGYQYGEATHLSNIAGSYADLGQTRRAIELHEQALTIDLEIGDRYGEALDHFNLGTVFADLGRWHDAVAQLREAVEVGDAIDNAQAQAEARRDLIWILLESGDLPAAIEVADTAGNYLYPPALAGIALFRGIVALRQGDRSAAEQLLRNAVAYADQRLATNAQDYEALDTKAVALAGLTITGPTDHTADAAAAYAAARTINRTPGIIARARRHFDALTAADPTGAIRRLRATLVDHGDAHS